MPLQVVHGGVLRSTVGTGIGEALDCVGQGWILLPDCSEIVVGTEVGVVGGGGVKTLPHCSTDAVRKFQEGLCRRETKEMLLVLWWAVGTVVQDWVGIQEGSGLGAILPA